MRRTALALVGLLTVALGWWGFVRYSGLHPEIGLGRSEWLYGTVNLFINGADVVPVPWQLGVARMLAPLVTFGVLVEVVLVAFAQRIRRWAASRASNHVIVVGPSERVRPYIDEPVGGDEPELVVHIGDGGSSLSSAVIGLPATSAPDEWVDMTPARAARRVVLTLGRDDLTLAALRSALNLGLPETGASLLVELDSLELSGRMAVAMAGERPDADIDFVCPDEVDALLTSAAVVDELAATHGTGRGWAVSIVGDTSTSSRVTSQLVRAFTRSALRGGAVRPSILRVHPGGIENQGEELGSSRVVVTMTDRVDAIFESGAPHHLVVDLDDTEQSTRLAMEAALRRRGSVVWTAHGLTLPWAVTEGAGGGASPVDLRQVSLSAAASDGTLLGPFGRIAARRSQRSDQPSVVSSAEPVRRAVGVLLAQGWAVVPESDLRPAARSRLPKYVDPDTARLLRALPGLAEDPSYFLYELHCEGLMAYPPLWESEGSKDRVEMPADEAIELMARVIHEHYVTGQAGHSDLPAMQPWAELDEVLRAQNRDQARDNISKLHAVGCRVIAVDASSSSSEPTLLEDDDVVSLGIAEHDRWSHQKREQGYRYGEVRVDAGNDLRHPSLVPWEELPAAEQEKDLDPIRRIQAVLAAAGFTMTRITDR